MTAKCDEKIWERGRGVHFHHCERTAVEDGKCTIHSKSYIAERAKKQRDRDKPKRARNGARIYGSTFLAALQTIVDGHNDPRAVAAKAIAKYEEYIK